MLDLSLIKKAKQAWIQASLELKFEMVCPYVFMHNGNLKNAFAFLPEFGSENGMIVGITGSPYFQLDDDIIEFAKMKNMYYSFININQYLQYECELFTETIEDWGKW